MKLGVYCIRDSKVGWLTPTVDHNDASAARNFVHAMKQTDSLLYSHSKDFDLWKIGTFDSEKGTLEPLFPGELVFEGASCEAEVK